MVILDARKEFVDMNFLAVDVDYREDKAYVAGICFSNGEKCKSFKRFITKVDGVDKYVSGELYKRELPCILQLLREYSIKPDCIIIDGYVYLDENNSPGLGKYFYDHFEGRFKVIGVAKNPREGMDNKVQVFRGESKKPLYVTAEGISLDIAKNIIRDMEGAYRIPTMLKLADTSCREAK